MLEVVLEHIDGSQMPVGIQQLSEPHPILYFLPDKPAVAKARVAQKMFRQMMRVNYDDSCAFCGFPEEGVLVAAHIARYADDPANRLNPHNGLLLCRLCDGAFELGMISINPDLTQGQHRTPSASYSLRADPRATTMATFRPSLIVASLRNCILAVAQLLARGITCVAPSQGAPSTKR